jgi:hypothetical protein
VALPDEIAVGDVPPTDGYEAIEAWLADAHYEAWRCEDAPRKSRAPSAPAMVRVCSNALLSEAGAGEYPVDASTVKEFYDPTGTDIIGYSVMRHTRPGTSGDTWYWYERVPLGSPEPHDARGVVADGWGAEGPARDRCIPCHSLSNDEDEHTGHDFIFTQIQ